MSYSRRASRRRRPSRKRKRKRSRRRRSRTATTTWYYQSPGDPSKVILMEPFGDPRLVDFTEKEYEKKYDLQAERQKKRSSISATGKVAAERICADEGVGTGPDGAPGCPILLEDFRTVVPRGGVFLDYLRQNRLRYLGHSRSAKEDPVGWYTQSYLSSSTPVTYKQQRPRHSRRRS